MEEKGIDIIFKHFGNLTEEQKRQFEQLGTLYPEWNQKINVISRKDIDNLYANHVLHSLAIAKFLGPLAAGTTFLDLGTGGGFPGVPLAILYPECTFHLIDRIGKKIKVATEISETIGLSNVTFQHGDIAECRQRYNYVVSRAVMDLNAMVPLIVKNISAESSANIYPNGLICLKGGDLEKEKKGIRYPVEEYPVTEFINEPQFDTKFILYVPIKK